MTPAAAWRAWLWAQHDYARAMRWLVVDRDATYLGRLFAARLQQTRNGLLPDWTPGGREWKA